MNSSKRIQIGLRERSLTAVETLAEEKNLSLSKMCGVLIEEALASRGLIGEGWSSTTVTKKVEPEDITEEDLKLLKKLKLLKELGI